MRVLQNTSCTALLPDWTAVSVHFACGSSSCLDFFAGGAEVACVSHLGSWTLVTFWDWTILVANKQFWGLFFWPIHSIGSELFRAWPSDSEVNKGFGNNGRSLRSLFDFPQFAYIAIAADIVATQFAFPGSERLCK